MLIVDECKGFLLKFYSVCFLFVIQQHTPVVDLHSLLHANEVPHVHLNADNHVHLGNTLLDLTPS